MNLRRQLDQSIGDCLNTLGRFWMFTPTIQAADDGELLMNDFLEDPESIPLWAGALVFAIARHNHLTGKKSALAISIYDIEDFFQINSDEIYELADQISEKLDLPSHPERYTEFDFPQLDTQFENGDDPDSEKDFLLAVFRYNEPIDDQTLNELDEMIRDEIEFFNEDEPDESHVHVISVRAEGSLLEVGLTGYADDIDLFCYEMEENDLLLEEIRYPDDDRENRYKPSSNYAMFMEQYETMGLDDLRFDNLADLEALIQSFVGKTADEIGREKDIPAHSRAMIEAIRSFDLPREQSLATVRDILHNYPRCVEAHLCLAGWEADRNLRLKMLRFALDEGEKDLDVTEIEQQKSWWLNHRTRPYMRAMRLLAEEDLAAGQREEGVAIFWRLLDMDKSDHMMNRLILLELSILERDWPSVDRLFKAYPKEDHIAFYYGKVIYLFHTIGRRPKTRKALVRAFERNRYPLRLVAGLEPYPDQDETLVMPGDKGEATAIIDFLLACFGDAPDLVEYFIHELNDLGAWDLKDQKFDITKNSFVPSTRIIPIDRQSDN